MDLELKQNGGQNILYPNVKVISHSKKKNYDSFGLNFRTVTQNKYLVLPSNMLILEKPLNLYGFHSTMITIMLD